MSEFIVVRESVKIARKLTQGANIPVFGFPKIFLL